MKKNKKSRFSLSPVLFKDSPIAGRGVFARQRFAPGDVICAYAPKQRRVDVADPEAISSAETKLTLLSEHRFVIIPDTTVPGGWLSNHSCNPNAAIYSSGDGRIQCTRAIKPGDEVTIFYGWVSLNQPERDPCLCGTPGCRRFINFDIKEADAREFEAEGENGDRVRARLREYEAFLRSIGQEQVMETIVRKLAATRARIGG